MTATHGEGPYGNAVGVTTPIEHKMAQITEFVKTTTKNIIRPGVLYNGDTSLVAGTAGMSYDVDAFSIVTQRSATSGVVKWANDGTVNVATTAAPGSNSRYDVVYAWHREYALDGVDSNPVIGVVQGTAAASPTVPSLSAFPGAVELARILVPAGVTATNSGTTITQTAPFTTVDGGTVPFRTLTEMNAWTTAITGQRASDITTGVIYRWSGSVWRLDSVPSVADGVARDALYSGTIVPAAGDRVFTADSGITWQYYALYNASTNPGGTTPAGWYPVFGEDMSCGAVRRQAVTLTNTSAVAGFGAGTNGLFAAPTGSHPFNLASTTYNSFFFTITQAGDIKVAVDGLYDLEFAIQCSNVNTVIQAYFVKNQSVIDNNSANTICGDDVKSGADVGPFIKGSRKGVRLLTTDTLRLVIKNTSATSTAFGYVAMDAAAVVQIRWSGIAHV